jgi:hypothetical protein
MCEVTRELQAFGDEALAPRQLNRRWQPTPLAFLVGDDQEDVGTLGNHPGIIPDQSV